MTTTAGLALHAVLGMLLMGAAVPASAPAQDLRRVRPLRPDLAAVVERGRAASPTFRSLLATLERSDIVSFLEWADGQPSQLRGGIVFMARACGYRFVRIVVARQKIPAEVIPILAHELQHAVEVAGANHIRCSASMEAHFRRIGVRTASAHYDTQAARAVAEQVRREITAAR